MNNFNIYTTEHLLEMKQEISTIISERETNEYPEEEVVPLIVPLIVRGYPDEEEEEEEENLFHLIVDGNPDEFIPRRPMHDKDKTDRRRTAQQKEWMESDDFKSKWSLVSKRTRTKAAVYKRIATDDPSTERYHALRVAAYKLSEAMKMNS